MAGNEQPSISQVTRDFLEDHPDGEQQLQSLLEVDAAEETWAFDDIPLDSGLFGEVVSRGIVENVGDEYRIADRAAVYEAVHGERPDQVTATTERSAQEDAGGDAVEEDGDGVIEAVSATVRSVSSVQRGLLVLGLLLIGLMRTVFHYGGVFRGDAVVLVGNDPYRRRYWVESLVKSDLQPWNPLDLGSLPTVVTNTDALFYWLAWTAAALGGDTTGAVSLVLAWYPVLTAMATGLAVYALAMRLTGDYRIGVASVCLLAVIPIHASYTALGFGDHHALDYLLLTLIAGALVLIVDSDPTVRVGSREFAAERVGAVALGVTLGAMNVAWEGAPLWFAGVGLYVLVQTAYDYHHGNPIERNLPPIFGGLALAAALTAGVWLAFGWLQPFRVLTPLLLLAGAGVVVATAFGGRRAGVPSRVAFPSLLLTGFATAAVAWIAVPPFSERVLEFQSYLERTAAETITETLPLFSLEMNVIEGPISYLGGVFVLGVPALGWMTWRALREDRPEWLVVTTLGWYLFGWATVQVRFAGEFAPFLALFAGIGFVALLSWIDLLDSPRLERDATAPTPASDGSGNRSDSTDWTGTMAAYVVGFFLFVSVLSFVFIPGFVNDITVNDDTYETARWLEDYSDEQGYEYPENYVFSPWGENRQYNYYVSGESDRYTFARENYEEFISSSNPDAWYPDLRPQVGFLVTHSLDQNLSGSITHTTLHKRFGSAADGIDGTSHFRVLYTTETRDRAVFELVPGARISGVGPPNTTIPISTQVEGEGFEFTYRREVTTNRYGDYGISIPYQGNYNLFGQPLSVSGEDIRAGTFLSSYRSHWTFDEGEGNTISDPVGGAKATVNSPEWRDGIRGNALRYTGDDATVIEDDPSEGVANGSFTISFWLKGEISNSGDAVILERSNAYRFWLRAETDEVGFRIGDIQGNGVQVAGIDNAEFDDWTLVTGEFNREEQELRLYRNTTLVDVQDASQIGPVEDSGRLSIGGSEEGDYASVTIDSIRFYSSSLDPERIRELHRTGQ